jgi:hypothetical protein
MLFSPFAGKTSSIKAENNKIQRLVYRSQSLQALLIIFVGSGLYVRAFLFLMVSNEQI